MLSDGSERIKFVVTSVPFFPDLKKQNNDKWSGFLSQRDQIIEHIRNNQIKKVVFLSGDVHCSMAAELDISLAEEESHKIYSVISSSFYWPYPHMKRRKFKLSGFVASEDNTNAYKLGEISDVFSGNNFTRIKASQEALNIFVYERKGNLEHQHKFLFENA
ncbi:alkaline phosphatase D family protein [Neptuniibacter sp.]|uniref:alkaline phosphatase D family protein n=1 Tax=Neptuniibacter sp. TaxID=1962643 RepID=UPI002637B749|nr:alkaline phosphatase D family protein [Neptuniibacter sp.]